jgi:hypothetical protein
MQLSKSFRPTLDDNQLARIVPSAFADHRKAGLSDRYAFIPTTRVVNLLRSQGWQPVKANQAKAMTIDGRSFVKHVIRFQSENHGAPSLTDSVPELVLTNSHNGASAFNLMMGIYRMVCANGMVAGDTWHKESIRHVGFKDDAVIEASYRVVGQAKEIGERVAEFQSINLTRDEQLAFARSSLTAHYGENVSTIRPEVLLMPRRYQEDKKTDLWTTFNVIQENSIKGGLRSVNRTTGRRSTTRAVTSVDKDVKLNRALWQLAESMRLLKTGQVA